ncbi:MAG: hypothetical protein S4CHLAM102_06780 [Chlamydiia bacterium]|nr:hypothetical protein [Chlamydiia bacterium]
MELTEALESFLATADSNQLLEAGQALSQSYLSNSFTGFTSEAMRMAYLAARMPATVGVIEWVLSRVGAIAPSSIVDVGSGPWSVLWALHHRGALGGVKKCQFYEKDAAFTDLARKLWPYAHVKPFDIEVASTFVPKEEQADLVTASYVLNELDEKEAMTLAQSLWKQTSQTLILIEPGTPAHYEKMMRIRRTLIADGANLLLPCPHLNECPLLQSGKGDWCHFRTRVSRSSLHRKIKGGALGYEDEKFTYLVFSRSQAHTHQATLLKKPLLLKNRIQLDLCTKQGIEQRSVTKKERDLYREARRWKGGEGLLNLE